MVQTTSIRDGFSFLTLVVLAVCTISADGRAAPVPYDRRYDIENLFLANTSDPGLGDRWTQPGFDDSNWAQGFYALGYDKSAEIGIQTDVAPRTLSIYSRHVFEVADPADVRALILHVDYDDGFVAWINGTEVARSASMPSGNPTWNTAPQEHESSHFKADRSEVFDLSAARPLLRPGSNLLAIGVWNRKASSSDLFLWSELEIPLFSELRAEPYLQMVSPTSVTLRWRTWKPETSRVVFGTLENTAKQEVRSSSLKTDHTVRLPDLMPNTVYHYAVGNGKRLFPVAEPRSQSFSTPPAPGTVQPIRVWVLGDPGTGTPEAREVRDAYYTHTAGTRTDAILTLGDNAYDTGTDAEFEEKFFGIYEDIFRQTPVWPSLGNHDAYSFDPDTGHGAYFDWFSLPTQGEAGGIASGTEAYYSFDHGNVHFISLDSYTSDRRTGGPMLQWLERDLAATDQEWIIAYWHHPPYSRGTHDSDLQRTSVEMRAHVVPLLESYGVDLVLAGHTHTYERSFAIHGHYGPSSSFSESHKRNHDLTEFAKPARGDVPYDERGDGTIYVQAGCSGSAGPGPLDHPAMHWSIETMGSVVLDIEGPKLKVRFLDRAGAVLDAFRIVKQSGGPITDR